MTYAQSGSPSFPLYLHLPCSSPQPSQLETQVLGCQLSLPKLWGTFVDEWVSQLATPGFGGSAGQFWVLVLDVFVTFTFLTPAALRATCCGLVTALECSVAPLAGPRGAGRMGVGRQSEGRSIKFVVLMDAVTPATPV